MSEPIALEYYKDAELKEKIDGPIDFDVVESGKDKTMKIYIKNVSGGILSNLKFVVSSSDVTVISSPLGMEKNAIGELVLKWSPPIDLRKGLSTDLSVECYIIYPP